MHPLAATIALAFAVIFFGKIYHAPRPLPAYVIIMLAVIEVAVVYFYMATIEIPVLAPPPA